MDNLEQYVTEQYEAYSYLVEHHNFRLALEDWALMMVWSLVELEADA